MINLVALCGPAGAGKTTLAEFLVRDFDFVRTRFAEPIKDMIHALLEAQGATISQIVRMLDGDLKETASPLLEGKTPRFAMQTLGTEWRNLIGQDLWVNAWDRRTTLALANNHRLVIDDLRFVHEAERIRSHGGICIFVTRPNFGPGIHASETEYLKIPVAKTIINDQSPEDMLEKIRPILENDNGRPT